MAIIGSPHVQQVLAYIFPHFGKSNSGQLPCNYPLSYHIQNRSPLWEQQLGPTAEVYLEHVDAIDLVLLALQRFKLSALVQALPVALCTVPV